MNFGQPPLDEIVCCTSSKDGIWIFTKRGQVYRLVLGAMGASMQVQKLAELPINAPTVVPPQGPTS